MDYAHMNSKEHSIGRAKTHFYAKQMSLFTKMNKYPIQRAKMFFFFFNLQILSKYITCTVAHLSFISFLFYLISLPSFVGLCFLGLNYIPKSLYSIQYLIKLIFGPTTLLKTLSLSPIQISGGTGHSFGTRWSGSWLGCSGRPGCGGLSVLVLVGLVLGFWGSD